MILQEYLGEINLGNHLILASDLFLRRTPHITLEIANLVIKFKKENPRWDYQKIRDQVVYLGYEIRKSSVKNILIENDYDPEPDLTV